MTILHFDIETIPSQLQWVKDDIRANIKHPGNMSKQDTIDKWYAEKADAAAEEQWLKTSFNGAVGEIVCIGYAFDDGDIQAVYRDDDVDEAHMLSYFMTDIERKIKETSGRPITWCGHHITGFDLRFLWQRLIVNNNYIPCVIPHNAKPWNQGVFDTCYEWRGDSSGYGSLDAVSKILGTGEKMEGMDGSQVWSEFQAGNYDKIAEYCRHDVQLSREIYKRIK